MKLKSDILMHIILLISGISGNFLINVILAFSAMSFELQIIDYAEIIFRIIIFKTLNRKKKSLVQIKNATHFPRYSQIL